MLNKIGRNQICPCGSGKKYKKCCLLSEENQKMKEMEFEESRKHFIEMKKKNFILEPYVECPECNKKTCGVQMDFSEGYEYVRGCIDCRYREKIILPPIQKKIIYLDQNIISEMTKVLDVRNPNHERIRLSPHYDFWVNAWKILNRLVNKQLILCPDSFFHKHESVVSKNRKKLFKVYEKLSHGVTFQPNDVVQRIQSNHYLKKYLGLISGEISFDPQTIVTGDTINIWHNNFRISVGQMIMPNEVENLRVSREKAYQYLQKVYPSWQSTTKTFDQITQDEANAFIKAQIGLIDKYIESQNKIATGEIESDIYNILPPFALDWLRETRKIIGLVTKDQDEHRRIINEFFLSKEILSIPAILISSLLYASVAVAAKNGAKIPTRGVFNDVQCISAYLPYCDAMFVDNENRKYLSSPQVSGKIIKFNTKIFSLSNKEEFISYLKDIEENANQEHMEIVKDFYRTDFSSNKIPQDFFTEEDED